MGSELERAAGVDGAVPVDFTARLEPAERRALAMLDSVLDGLENVPAVDVRLRRGHAGDQLAHDSGVPVVVCPRR